MKVSILLGLLTIVNGLDVWTEHTGINCYPDHGGTAMESSDTPFQGLNLEQCEAKCSSMDGCTAIVVEVDGQKINYCWVRSAVKISKCQGSQGKYNTYTKMMPPSNWTEHPGINCYPGHGGTAMDSADTPFQGLNLTQCEAQCSSMDGCTAIVVEIDGQNVGYCWVRSAVRVSECEGSQGKYDTYTKVIPPYINHFPSGNNPYNMQVGKGNTIEQIRNNSFVLLIGDFGLAQPSSKTGSCCQTLVADSMRKKRALLESQGKRLVFIAAVGDNFYWTGLSPEGSSHGIDQWKRWQQVYRGLTDVPWLAVHGNHDLGDSDTYAVCPEEHARVTIEGQAYGSNQMDPDKGGFRMGGDTLNFHLPDFNYHYRIDVLDLEVFALDENVGDINGIGGDSGGRKKVQEVCGGDTGILNRLSLFEQSGEDMMTQFARAGGVNKTHTRNVLVLQHYPGDTCKDLEDIFRSAAPVGESIDFRCAFGHVHNTRCDAAGVGDDCIFARVGGGGGCCSSDVVKGGAGFGVLHFKSTGGLYIELVQDVGPCNFAPEGASGSEYGRHFSEL